MSTLEEMEEINRLSLALSDVEAYAVLEVYEVLRPRLEAAGYEVVDLPEALTPQEQVSVLSIAQPAVASTIAIFLVYGPDGLRYILGE